MKEESPHWRRRVYAVGQAAEINAAFAQFFYQNDQMTHTAIQAIELPYPPYDNVLTKRSRLHGLDLSNKARSECFPRA
ncbi:hypothetical protein ABI57_16305 [Salmonella enterica subsp. enterica serovar Veneziana]|nr:hypothetical protein ABI57_16305 [Salmonella enterica subsp. enterica serovar Veneziana]